jgi:ArsR family transcriptional regulator
MRIFMIPFTSDTDVLAAVFKAAGEPIRLRLLARLAHGELCVCHLHAALAVPQPTVSRHLAVLRHAGLVRTRREGAWVHYGLTEAAETWLAPALAQWRTQPTAAPIDGERCS